MSPEVLGLRERKKQRTRETIVRAAMELFAERGYEATTINDIAEAADIAPRTFFGYFPSKEAVVFHDADELFAGCAQRLREREEGETAFDALRAWVLGYVAQIDVDDPLEIARRQMVHATPVLAAQERAEHARFEEIMREAIAKDLGVPPTSPRPHMVAAAATAALDTFESIHDEHEAPDAARVAAVMDEVVVFLQGGLDALRRHPPG